MQTLTYSLSEWSTEELIGEVVSRAAGDAMALRSIEAVIIRARLAESDGRSAQSEFPATLLSPVEAAVRGTIEMGLADDGEI